MTTSGELWICADSVSGMEFLWKIENFFNRSSDAITSREFKLSNYSCKISVLPSGTEQKKDIISFCVLLFCRNRPKSKCGVQLTLKTDQGKLHDNATRKEIHESRDAIIYICDFPQNTFYGEGNTNSAILEVSCKISIESIPEEQAPIVEECPNTHAEPTIDRESETIQSTPCNGSTQDFTMLSINGNDSDVTIRVMEENFRVHKSIFVARAPAFATVLQEMLTETDTDTVVIDDFCGVPAFRAFLHFVYKGEVKNITKETALELYVFADIYNLKELKELSLKCTKRGEYKPIVLAA